MMENIVTINGNNLTVKMWNGQRVVTLLDIDNVHGRPEGTAKKNFQNNRKHFVANEDYFELTREELREKFSPNSEPLKGNPKLKTYLFTESGYLMVAKSFTDDLAWSVQRQLVNSYFKFKEVVESFNTNYPINAVELNKFLMETMKNLPCFYAQMNNVEEMLGEQNEMLTRVVDNMTLTTRQQQRIYKAAKDRINHLLGGTHSKEYKDNSKSYFINLWNGMKSKFGCGSSYKDLNPIYFDEAMEFIATWEYIEA